MALRFEPAVACTCSRVEPKCSRALRASRRRRNEFSNSLLAHYGQTLQVPGALIVRDAKPPHAPAAPERAQLVALAAAAGLIIAIALAFLLEFREPRRPCIEDVQRALTCPHMTSVPAIDRRPSCTGTNDGRCAASSRNRRYFMRKRSETPAKRWNGTAKAAVARLCSWYRRCRAKARNCSPRTSPTISRSLEVRRFSSMQICE